MLVSDVLLCGVKKLMMMMRIKLKLLMLMVWMKVRFASRSFTTTSIFTSNFLKSFLRVVMMLVLLVDFLLFLNKLNVVKMLIVR